MNKSIPQVTINLCRNVGITPARFLTREDISQIYPGSSIVSPALWQLIQTAQGDSNGQGQPSETAPAMCREHFELYDVGNDVKTFEPRNRLVGIGR